MRRFSIAKMMLVIALVGTGFAAMRIPPSAIRTSALFGFTVFIFLVATLGSILNRRPSWIGFCLFGWAWLVVSFAALTLAPWNSTADKTPVPISILSLSAMDLHDKAFGGDVRAGDPMAVIPNFKGGHTLVSYHLVQDCTSLSCILMACVGGLVAWILRAAYPPAI